MLKISTRGQYALLIMTELAVSETDKYIPLKILGSRLNLSVKYLEQILIQLSKANLVLALRGNNGGYKLSKKSVDYTAGEILRALEGNLSPKGVTEKTEGDSSGNEDFWNGFEAAINNYVDSVSLEKLAESSKKGIDYMYYI